MVSCTQVSTNFQPSRFQLTESVESYQMIWLEQNMANSYEKTLLQKQLREAINQLILFDNVTDCREKLLNLSSAMNEKVILIVADHFSNELLPSVHDLKPLCAVYIYCAALEGNHDWKRQFFKVRCRCNQIKTL